MDKLSLRVTQVKPHTHKHKYKCRAAASSFAVRVHTNTGAHEGPRSFEHCLSCHPDAARIAENNYPDVSRLSTLPRALADITSAACEWEPLPGDGGGGRAAMARRAGAAAADRDPAAARGGDGRHD